MQGRTKVWLSQTHLDKRIRPGAAQNLFLIVLPDPISYLQCTNQSIRLKGALGTHHDLLAIDGDVPRRCESVLFCHRAKGVTEPPHQSPTLLVMEPGTTNQRLGMQCLRLAASRQCTKCTAIASCCVWLRGGASASQVLQGFLLVAGVARPRSIPPRQSISRSACGEWTGRGQAISRRL